MLEVLGDRSASYPDRTRCHAPRGPATSLALDLVAWLPTLLVLGRAALDRTFRVRFTLAHVLMLARTLDDPQPAMGV